MKKKTEKIILQIIGTISSFFVGMNLALATVGKPRPIFFIPFIGSLALSILISRRIKKIESECD